jgi:1,4-dihydroxy-6-naphthoate synthase
MTSLRLGFSPCPNDCFIFDALIHGRVASDLRFEVTLEDVEGLNQLALADALEVAKVSYHAAGHLASRYWLLRSGGALGRGVGPLIVTRPERRAPDGGIDLRGLRVAVPGGTTTAKLLLRLFEPAGVEEVEVRYDRIMPAVAAGDFDAGLIIHESRFTYPGHGLVAPVDLGAWWEGVSGSLLPLGGIAVRRDLGLPLAREVERVVRASVAHAFAHPQDSEAFVAAHAQEMSPTVRRAHIDLYVNAWSLDVGPEGEEAARKLLGEARRIGLTPALPADLYLP